MPTGKHVCSWDREWDLEQQTALFISNSPQHQSCFPQKCVKKAQIRRPIGRTEFISKVVCRKELCVYYAETGRTKEDDRSSGETAERMSPRWPDNLSQKDQAVMSLPTCCDGHVLCLHHPVRKPANTRGCWAPEMWSWDPGTDVCILFWLNQYQSQQPRGDPLDSTRSGHSSTKRRQLHWAGCPFFHSFSSAESPGMPATMLGRGIQK